MNAQVPAQPNNWFAAFQNRTSIRLSQLRTTGLTTPGALQTTGDPVGESLKFDRLTPFLLDAASELPRWLCRRDFAVEHLEGRRTGRIEDAISVHEALIDVPSGAVQLLRTIDLPNKPLPTVIRLLEDLYYEDLLPWTDQLSVADWAEHCGLAEFETDQTCDYHQFVFLPARDASVDWDTLQRLIYRADLDAEREFSIITYPDELNRRPLRGCAHGPFVSVLWGQQDYVENLALLSACQVVAANERVRHVRSQTYEQMQSLDRRRAAGVPGSLQWKGQLIHLQERISELEVALTFGVEAAETLMPLVPSMRAEAYHRSLYEVADVSRQARLAGRMLERLRGAVTAEVAAIETHDAIVAGLRSRRWSIAGQILAAIAIPIGILLGFFGVSAREVDGNRSMFDMSAYGRAYALIAGLVLVMAALVVVLRRIDDRRAPETLRSRASSQGPAGPADQSS